MYEEIFDAEAAFVALAYQRLGETRSAIEAAMKEVIDLPRGGTHQSRLERDVVVESSLKRLGQLDIGEHPLVFGRIDYGPDDPNHAGQVYRVGRLSLNDASGDPLVIDWRAPVSEPFYRATVANPMGLRGRYHLQVSEGRLSGLESEPFSLEAEQRGRAAVVGRAALFAALERPRSPQMLDIVATIQAEQDDLIRRPLGRALVVEGSPGTGKTAVALHRAAYLLYTYRWRLERQGLLVIGPSAGFVSYVRSVLPSLGESGVDVRSVAGLRRVDRTRGPEVVAAVSRVKGDPRMATLIRRAIGDRERGIRDPVGIPFGTRILTVTPALVERAIASGRSGKGGHNQRRRMVEEVIATALAQDYLGNGPLAKLPEELGANVVSLFDRDSELPVSFPEETGEEVLAEVILQIRREIAFQRLVERIWPLLTAEQLLGDLFTYRALLRSAGGRLLSDREIGLLQIDKPREPGEIAWSDEDTLLLDEADRLLTGKEVTVYGHVVIDEAQDLSPMAARAIRRRASGTSFTILGDLAQATGPFRGRPWERVLSAMGVKEFDLVSLGLNYRAPRRVGQLAQALRGLIHPGYPASEEIVRETAGVVEVVRAPRAAFSAEISALVSAMTGEDGTAALLAPTGSEMLSPGSVRAICHLYGPVGSLWVSDVPGVRGMEFDSVVVADAGSLGEESLAIRLLYVAVTRCTRRLTLLVDESIPSWLEAVLSV